MAIKIYEIPLPYFRNVIVSDNTNDATARSEINQVLSENFPGRSIFILSSTYKIPHSMITQSEYRTLSALGIEVISSASLRAIIDAYDAANP